MGALPALFLSHGAPTLAIEPCPAHRFLGMLGDRLGKPRAIVIVSAHHWAPKGARGRVDVTTSAAPPMIYDFRGFPDALYRMTYPAPGSPDLAADIIDRLNGAGFEAHADDARGFDHGAWVPLMLMYPDADVPVIQLSLNMAETSGWHRDLGRALAPLRDEGVLLVGSGNTTHNLRAFFEGGTELDSPAPDWVTGFTDWLRDRVASGDEDAILNAVASAPGGKQNHPTLDHIHPLFFAIGASGVAGGSSAMGRRIHHSVTYGVLAMDMYAFGDAASLAHLSEQEEGDPAGPDHFSGG